MNRIMPAALLLLALAAPAGAADRRLTVTEFDRVQVDGPFEVVVVTGRSTSARVSGSVQALDRVSVEVQGRLLRVRPNRSAWGGYPGEGVGPVRVELATHDLRGASISGSGSLSIDKARGLRFEAAVSGSAKLDLGRVEADVLTLGLLGSGRIAVAGKVKSLRATIQGSGDLAAAGLAVDDAVVNADTSGKVALAVQRAAKITATGSGNVEVAGSPACTVKSLGSGRVACGN
jgi:hypothetical protein